MDRKERDVFARGDELVVGPGGVGLACCYDLAFPEVSRLLALGGARLLVVPMAWEVARGYVMQRVVAARAVENVAYVVCVNQSGAIGDLRFLGASCVLDPLGQVVAALGAEDELGFADVDPEWVDRLRGGDDERAYPLLEDRRPELYGELQTFTPKTITSYVRHQYAAAEPTGWRSPISAQVDVHRPILEGVPRWQLTHPSRVSRRARQAPCACRRASYRWPTASRCRRPRWPR